mmetsp:Transcript_814/g.691  ORF Transcript_814/g.691 Transcript_814/m.691 type:complete len:331 (+) Transcript_814:147-1139(+)
MILSNPESPRFPTKIIGKDGDINQNTLLNNELNKFLSNRESISQLLEEFSQNEPKLNFGPFKEGNELQTSATYRLLEDKKVTCTKNNSKTIFKTKNNNGDRTKNSKSLQSSFTPYQKPEGERESKLTLELPKFTVVVEKSLNVIGSENYIKNSVQVDQVKKTAVNSDCVKMGKVDFTSTDENAAFNFGQSSMRPVATKKETNILTKMKKFYQALYLKTSKSLPKDNNSKKRTLETLCNRLRKVTILGEIESEELALHLGSVIYPSNTFLKNKASFTSYQTNFDEDQMKVKRLILLFQDCLHSFTPQKLEGILSQNVFEKLYRVFCENLET